MAKRKLKPFELIHKIDSLGFEYKVLNETNGEPAHIRIKEFGDIWPQTGTFKAGDTWTKRNPNLLMSRLDQIAESKAGEIIARDENRCLQEQIDNLTERLEQMDEELDAIKAMLAI